MMKRAVLQSNQRRRMIAAQWEPGVNPIGYFIWQRCRTVRGNDNGVGFRSLDRSHFPELGAPQNFELPHAAAQLEFIAELVHEQVAGVRGTAPGGVIFVNYKRLKNRP